MKTRRLWGELYQLILLPLSKRRGPGMYFHETQWCLPAGGRDFGEEWAFLFIFFHCQYLNSGDRIYNPISIHLPSTLWDREPDVVSFLSLWMSFCFPDIIQTSSWQAININRRSLGYLSPPGKGIKSRKQIAKCVGMPLIPIRFKGLNRPLVTTPARMEFLGRESCFCLKAPELKITCTLHFQGHLLSFSREGR